MEINKIKTKFSIGDKVYLLHNNKVVKGKIYLIEVNITICYHDRFIDIYYKVADKDNKLIGTFPEEFLYETELELMTK